MTEREPERYTPEHASPAHAAPGTLNPNASEGERIYLSEPDIGAAERQVLLAAFDSLWTTPIGSEVATLETTLCNATGTPAAVATASGTAAMNLGLVTLGVGAGDIVVVPSLVSTATANVIRHLGASLVIVDCEPATGNIDPNLLDIALRGLINGHQLPAAVVAVDLYGSCADYSRIEALCRHYRTPLLEDATMAIGAHHNDRPAGSFGSLAAVSFSGGGGALVGRRHPIARAYQHSEQARSSVLHYEHDEAGYAYHLSNLLAAVASTQLDRVGDITSRRRAINARYGHVVSMLPGVSLLDIDSDGYGNGALSVVHLEPGMHPTPAEICERMDAHNIEARPTRQPLQLLPSFAHEVVIGSAASEEHFATGVCLPSGAGLTSADQERVIASFISALSNSPEPSTTAAIIDLNGEVDVRTGQPQQHLDSRAATQRAA